MDNSKATNEEKKGGAKKMLVRIGVGLGCAAFAVFLLCLTGYGQVKYLGIVMSAVCALCIHEVLGISGCKNRLITYIMMVFAGCVPLYFSFGVRDDAEAVLPGITIMLAVVYILAVLIMMLKMYDNTRFEHVAIGLFMSFALPLSVSCLTFLHNYVASRSDIFSTAQIIFVLLMAMYCAWLCDTFALFVGSAFGKHKMAPRISPKKSVEGAIGGIVGTTAVALITYFICHTWYFKPEVINTIKWWMVLIAVPCICVLGMCGDLAASVIKRNYGVKDFGTLLPEHGGAMDRIDSFLFTMPATYILVRFLAEVFA